MKSNKPRNIKEMLEIPVRPENEYCIEGWIDGAHPNGETCEEDKERLLRILQNDTSYNLIAHMGTGKTTSIVKTALDSGIKMVMAFPLQANVIQLGTKVKNRYNKTVGVIKGKSKDSEGKIIAGTSKEEVTEMLANPDINVFLVVYDSLGTLIRNNLFTAAEYILVVDEAHNLVTQYDYRCKAINALIEARPDFRKIIYLSGTPEGTFFFNEYETIKFIKAPSSSKPIDIKVIPYQKEILYTVFNHILSYTGKGRIVVVKDDIEFLVRLQRALIGAGIDSKHIKIFSREEKQSEEFIYLMDNEKIFEDIRFLLTTRVISDGANIHEHIDRIYIINSADYWMKRQMISRFRSGVNTVYDFVYQTPSEPEGKGKKKRKPKQRPVFTSKSYNPLFDIRSDFSTMIHNMEMSKLIKQEDIKLMGQGDGYYENKRIYIDSNGDLRVAKEGVAYALINKINRILTFNPDIANKFYSDIAYYNAQIVTLEEQKQLDNYEEKYSRDDFRKLTGEEIPINDFPSFAEENMSQIFTAYCFKEKRLDLLLDKDLDKELITKDSDHLGFYKRHKSLFKEERIMKSLLLAEEGYPKEFIISVIKLEYLRKNTSVDNLLVQLNSYFNYCALRDYPRLVDHINQYNVFRNYRITQFILDNLNLNVRILFSPLKNAIAQFAVQEQVENTENRSFLERSIAGIFTFEQSNANKRKEFKQITATKYQSLEPIIEAGLAPVGRLSRGTMDSLEQIYLKRLKKQILQIEADNIESGDTMPVELTEILASVNSALKSPEKAEMMELFEWTQNNRDYPIDDDYEAGTSYGALEAPGQIL